MVETKEKKVTVSRETKEREAEWLEEDLHVEFYNLEEPGVPLKFAYGPANRSTTYTLLHGGKYHLPRKVVRHVESRQTPIWGYKPDGNGVMEKTLKGYKSRFQCRQIFE